MAQTKVFLLLSLFVGLSTQAQVTNEDIRNAILQIINYVRATDGKLERHEYREQILGEQLKKAMVNIDKRVRGLDPLKGSMSRLDERLAAVETILIEKADKERMQLQRTYEVALDIQKNLPYIVDKLKNDIIAEIVRKEPPAAISEPTMSKKDFEKLEKEMLNKMDKVSSTINSLESEIGKIRNDNKQLNDINNKSSENLEKVKRQLDTSEQLLSKYENKLAEYNNKIPEFPLPDLKEQDAWKDRFVEALDAQKSKVNDVHEDLKKLKNQINILPQKFDLDLAQNNTLRQLAEIKTDSQDHATRTVGLITPLLQQINDNLNNTKEDNAKHINFLSEINANLAESFNTNYEKIWKEIQGLRKVEQVMLQSVDNVIDTKRRVEFGVQKIISEIEKQMKEGTNSINQELNDRIDNLEISMFDEESGALANVTTKIGADIHQVWRQISIMHQQMSASTDTLNKLQNQTDSYVNGSLSVMDNMKSKLFQITERMVEVDENLNYLLGRLSLVTQEFNSIKTGLGKALEKMRGSFHEVQDKIEDSGPGRHNISSNEVVQSN